MFAHIPDRDHYPIQIYTHGHDQMQLMARGKVEYRHHAGHETDSEWAAYYELIEEDGQIKFKKIHIIVVSQLTVVGEEFVLTILLPRTLVHMCENLIARDECHLAQLQNRSYHGNRVESVLFHSLHMSTTFPCIHMHSFNNHLYLPLHMSPSKYCKCSLLQGPK